MQIHELPAGTPAAGMTFAGDTGTQTQKIDYDALADAILNKLTTKTFDIESESQTIIAALNALGDAAKQGVANNLVTTGAGYVLDARQGKALSDLHATNANAIAALNSRTGTTRFILTNGTKLSRGTAIGYYDKATGTVRINFSFTASSAISANETIFSAIPSAYRPASNMGGSGVIVTSASATPVFYTYTANSSGNIIQTLGNTVMSGMGYIEYEV